MGSGGTMDGCGKCMKYSLFVANFVILLGGIAVTAVGGVTLHDQHYFEKLTGGDELYKSSSYVLIGTGVFIMVFAFMGCFGAIKEVKCLLLTYIIFLFIIFVVLLIGGVLGFVFRGKAEDSIRNEMANAMKRYPSDDAIRAAWDNVQSVFHCCGAEDYHEWEAAVGRVPDSCCKDKDTCRFNSNRSPSAYWRSGCLEKFKDGAVIVGGVGIGVACLLILGLIFSCGVFYSIS